MDNRNVKISKSLKVRFKIHIPDIQKASQIPLKVNNSNYPKY